VGHLAAALPPPPLTRGQPWAVSGPISSAYTSRGGAYKRLHRSLTMGVGVRPGARAGAGRLPVDHGLPPCGDLPAPWAAAAPHHGFTRLLMDGTQALPLIRLTRRGKPAVRPPRAPPRARGRQPAPSAGGRLVERLPGMQRIAGRFQRLWWSASSGAGRLSWGWGRLSARPASGSARRTVAAEPRSPGRSARSSARRCRVHQASGTGQRRGRRRTAARHSARGAACLATGRPGRGASGTPALPAARSRLSQRRTVASRSRTRAASWGPLSRCAAARKTIWARLRRRGAWVGRERGARAWRGLGVTEGHGRGLMGPVYHQASRLSWLDLDACRHISPGLLDHRTIQKSGRLPFEFLLGCGMTRELTEAILRLLEV
jgi:hypothetical protein